MAETLELHRAEQTATTIKSLRRGQCCADVRVAITCRHEPRGQGCYLLGGSTRTRQVHVHPRLTEGLSSRRLSRQLGRSVNLWRMARSARLLIFFGHSGYDKTSAQQRL